ncbi:MAG: signal peptidase II [Mycobacterium leprae]
MLSIILGIIVVILDQSTKYLVATRLTEFQEVPIIRGFFSLQYLHNPGAAFGMLKNQQWIFIVVSLVAIGAILYYLRFPEAKRGLVPWALGFLMGGAAGNMIDRLRHKEVVDFLMFYHKSYVFPNFNVADTAITLGVGLFILHIVLTGEKKGEGV